LLRPVSTIQFGRGDERHPCRISQALPRREIRLARALRISLLKDLRH
jgi:hypothetical protein